MKSKHRGEVLTVLLAALVLSFVPARAADIAVGKAVFDTKCQKCHGDDGKGNPAMARLLKMKQAFTPLGTAEVQNKTDEELKKIAINGVRTARAEMKPVKGGLSEADAAAVVTYLRTLRP